MKSIKEISKNYDLIYEEVDKLIDKYNPCQFENGKCIIARENNTKVCCKPCFYLTGKGCNVKALGCKVSFCPEIWKLFSELLICEFMKLRHKVAEKVAISALVCYDSKEDFIKRVKVEKAVKKRKKIGAI